MLKSEVAMESCETRVNELWVETSTYSLMLSLVTVDCLMRSAMSSNSTSIPRRLQNELWWRKVPSQNPQPDEEVIDSSVEDREALIWRMLWHVSNWDRLQEILRWLGATHDYQNGSWFGLSIAFTEFAVSFLASALRAWWVEPPCFHRCLLWGCCQVKLASQTALK